MRAHELSAREWKFARLSPRGKVYFFNDPNFYLLNIFPVFSRKALPWRGFQKIACQVAPNAKKNIQLGIQERSSAVAGKLLSSLELCFTCTPMINPAGRQHALGSASPPQPVLVYLQHFSKPHFRLKGLKGITTVHWMAGLVEVSHVLLGKDRFWLIW